MPTVLTRNLSPELTGLVTRMMAPDPNARPTIYDVLAHPHVAAEVKARRRNRLLRFMFLLWAKLMGTSLLHRRYAATTTPPCEYRRWRLSTHSTHRETCT